MDTTTLVHEAYLRFVNSGELRADDRRAFFAYASSVMRSVLSIALANGWPTPGRRPDAGDVVDADRRRAFPPMIRASSKCTRR